jgi:hypothetical protein
MSFKKWIKKFKKLQQPISYVHHIFQFEKIWLLNKGNSAM